jgi:RNA polymerase sigma factor (TIGR02999 family)
VDETLSALLASAEAGDRSAAERLFTALYSELHQLARRELARQGAGQSLGVTTLLHEAYLDMSGRASASFPDRARFMGYAARVMRGLIIEHARSRRAQKRGGQFELAPLDTEVVENQPDAPTLSRLGDAVDELTSVDPPLGQLVDLKFFCGFSFAEIAAMRGVSERTIQRDWEKARIYLHRTMRADVLS